MKFKDIPRVIGIDPDKMSINRASEYEKRGDSEIIAVWRDGSSFLVFLEGRRAMFCYLMVFDMPIDLAKDLGFYHATSLERISVLEAIRFIERLPGNIAYPSEDRGLILSRLRDILEKKFGKYAGRLIQHRQLASDPIRNVAALNVFQKPNGSLTMISRYENSLMEDFKAWRSMYWGREAVTNHGYQYWASSDGLSDELWDAVIATLVEDAL